jgi:DNA-binding NarL/FixJ family response regulator
VLRPASQGHLIFDPSAGHNLIEELTRLRESRRGLVPTRRQREFLRLVADSTRYKEVAGEFDLTETTVIREMR